MRVLISAIACHPHQGSESHVGWAAVSVLAPRHDITVLTHTSSVEDLQAAAREKPALRNVRFIGVGKTVAWHPNRLLARLQSWGQYTSWCRDAHAIASRLVRTDNFDIAHHVTYATWRQTSPLYDIGIPWVLGPVGGAEQLPGRFRAALSLQTRLFESARDISTQVAKRSPKLKRSLQSAAFVLASTLETEKLLTTMGVHKERIGLSPAIFMPSDRIAVFKSNKAKAPSSHLRIFAGGNLEGRKGLALALHALAEAKKRGVPFVFTFAGYGPELPHLKQLAARLALDSNCVSFRDSLPLDKYRDALQNSDVYLLPSLRESGGLTLGEAMLAGCVPIVVKAGGPGLLVTPECGYAFEPESPAYLVEQITDTLQTLWLNPEHLALLSKNVVTRAETALSDARYLESVESAYRASAKA
jgi:glycosyltransferase involved in cell wall biosynthesis